MVRGKDGRLYYTDQAGDYDVRTAGPNVKQIKGKTTTARGVTGTGSSGAVSINDDIE